LAKQTAPKLKAIMDAEYVHAHSRTLVEMENSGLFMMLANDMIDDLKRLYQLFGRVQATTLHNSVVCLDLLRENLGE
jgi:hypothetical protein